MVSAAWLSVVACASMRDWPLRVDAVVHADDCRRIGFYVIEGPSANDCDSFTGAISQDGCDRNGGCRAPWVATAATQPEGTKLLSIGSTRCAARSKSHRAGGGPINDTGDRPREDRSFVWTQ